MAPASTRGRAGRAFVEAGAKIDDRN